MTDHDRLHKRSRNAVQSFGWSAGFTSSAFDACWAEGAPDDDRRSVTKNHATTASSLIATIRRYATRGTLPICVCLRQRSQHGEHSEQFRFMKVCSE